MKSTYRRVAVLMSLAVVVAGTVLSGGHAAAAATLPQAPAGLAPASPDITSFSCVNVALHRFQCSMTYTPSGVTISWFYNGEDRPEFDGRSSLTGTCSPDNFVSGSVELTNSSGTLFKGFTHYCREKVPDVRSMDADHARATLQSSGFATSVKGRIDHSCNSIGLVMSQSPSAGSRVTYGSTVTITIGTPPSHPCP
jgi:hypothetical protein